MSNTSDVAVGNNNRVLEINIIPAIFRPAEFFVEGLERRRSCNNESVKLLEPNSCWEKCRLLRQSGLVSPLEDSRGTGRSALGYA